MASIAAMAVGRYRFPGFPGASIFGANAKRYQMERSDFENCSFGREGFGS